MTWPAIVAEHAGHWLRFDGPEAVRCHPCDRRLLLPLRPDLAPTPTPAPFAKPTEPPASPETVAAARRRVDAELAALKQRRTTAPTAKDET